MLRCVRMMVLGMGALCASTVVALAQAAADSGPEEVVVTAQRRVQPMQKVPIAMSVTSAAVLDQFQVKDMIQIQALVPGLTVARSNINSTPYLRGVGQAAGSIGVDSPIAAYIDGFYVAWPTATVFSLTSVDHIEVLKGPQGTLFGRNATGGVIQVVTRDPSGTTSLDATASYGNYDTTDLRLYGETALSDDLAVGVGLMAIDENEGWGRNVFSGTRAFYDHERVATAKAVWTPTSDTTVKLLATYNHLDTDIGLENGIWPGSVAADGHVNIGRYTLDHVPASSVTDQYMLGLTVEQDLHWATLVSLTGYQQLDNNNYFVIGASPGSAAPFKPVSVSGGQLALKNWTQEVQLLSPEDSELSWIVGFFYLHDTQDGVFRTCTNVASVCNPPYVATPLFANQRTTSYAGFGQATYNVTDDLHVTAGLRYTSDKKALEGSQAGAAVPFAGAPYPGNPAGIPTDSTWSKLTYRASVDYQITPDMMAFASYNTGFRSGTYVLNNWTNPPARPEEITAYEAGVKSEWLDRKLRLNSSVFYYQYDDIQLRRTALSGGTFVTFNAAQSEIYGLDLDFDYVASSELTIVGGLELLHAEYTSFPSGPCTTPAVIGGTTLGGAVTAVCDLSGNDMIRAPSVTANLGVRYSTPLWGGTFNVFANDGYNSGFAWDPDNRLQQKSYHMVNATVGWSPNERWRFELWSQNLLDAEVNGAAQAAQGGTDDYSPGAPRTFGVRVGTSW